MTITIDRSTPDNENFWKTVEATARTVDAWPEWKKQYVVAAVSEEETNSEHSAATNGMTLL
ncbi:MAG: hypothetical protein ACTHQM_15235 [Thermoanaerobaculia bacterium]